MATTDYPSSAGNAMLNNAAGKNDAAFTTLFRNANAIAFGKTNVPDFAASWVSRREFQLFISLLKTDDCLLPRILLTLAS